MLCLAKLTVIARCSRQCHEQLRLAREPARSVPYGVRVPHSRGCDNATIVWLTTPPTERNVDDSAPLITLTQAACALKHSHSHVREDILLLPTLLLHAAALGTQRRSRSAARSFVEIGALDGVSFSNTYMLERCFGWYGLLVEASPANYRKLLRSERKARKVHSAVCAAAPGATVTFMSGADLGPFAAQVDSISAAKLAKIPSKLRGHSGVVNVSCKPLTAIQRRAGVPSAAFLSLDVEGAEDKVIAESDPAAFALIMAESMRGDQSDAKDQRVRKAVHRAGLRTARHLRVSGSEIYVQPHVVEVFVKAEWLAERAFLFYPTAEQLVSIVRGAGRTVLDASRRCNDAASLRGGA